jgi:hypothetical protein
MYVLEIEAEGMPRYVGPWIFRHTAEAWASERIANGSWSVTTLTNPLNVGEQTP